MGKERKRSFVSEFLLATSPTKYNKDVTFSTKIKQLTSLLHFFPPLLWIFSGLLKRSTHTWSCLHTSCCSLLCFLSSHSRLTRRILGSCDDEDNVILRCCWEWEGTERGLVRDKRKVWLPKHLCNFLSPSAAAENLAHMPQLECNTETDQHCFTLILLRTGWHQYNPRIMQDSCSLMSNLGSCLRWTLKTLLHWNGWWFRSNS